MGAMRQLRIIHLSIFAGFLIAWTIALLVRIPHESAEKVLGGPWHVFLFGKGLHVTAYAFLTMLGGTIALFGRRWWWVAPGLVVHGSLIEFFQQFTGRTGRIEDVGLDSIGIVLGTLAIVYWRKIKSGRGPREGLSSPASEVDSAGPSRHPLPTSRPSLPRQRTSAKHHRFGQQSLGLGNQFGSVVIRKELRFTTRHGNDEPLGGCVEWIRLRAQKRGDLLANGVNSRVFVEARNRACERGTLGGR